MFDLVTSISYKIGVDYYNYYYIIIIDCLFSHSSVQFSPVDSSVFSEHPRYYYLGKSVCDKKWYKLKEQFEKIKTKTRAKITIKMIYGVSIDTYGVNIKKCL